MFPCFSHGFSGLEFLGLAAKVINNSCKSTYRGRTISAFISGTSDDERKYVYQWNIAMGYLFILHIYIYMHTYLFIYVMLCYLFIYFCNVLIY